MPVVVGEAGVLGLLVPGRGVPGDGDLLTVQYSTVQYRYSTVQCSTVQHCTVVRVTCSSWKMGSSTSSLVSPASRRGQHGVSEDLRLSIRM